MDEQKPTDPEEASPIHDQVIAALRTVFDPEIPVNIYDMGLIYKIEIDDGEACARIDMTLTSPSCPVAGTLPGEVETRVREVDGIDKVLVDLVWDPPWDPSNLSEAARLELGLM